MKTQYRIGLLFSLIVLLSGISDVFSADRKGSRGREFEFEEHTVEGLGRNERNIKNADLSANAARSELFKRKTDFNIETRRTFKEMRHLK